MAGANYLRINVIDYSIRYVPNSFHAILLLWYFSTNKGELVPCLQICFAILLPSYNTPNIILVIIKMIVLAEAEGAILDVTLLFEAPKQELPQARRFC